MAIIDFPPIELADENGLLAIGGDLELESLLMAYTRGIFPWPISHEYPLAWFSPDPRGILYFDKLHVPRRLKRALKDSPFTFKFNSCFEEVINNCAQVSRKGQSDTWITEEIIEGYHNLHRADFAYSIEVFNSQKLVAGIYGVYINGFVSGESMFFNENNASKFALISLCQHLSSKGIKWLDTQMVTPIVSQLGGEEIPRDQFTNLLSQCFSSSPLSFEQVFSIP
tara:strand:- start:195054 stop:195728 length:675 start_codon:yes stop_codon:yes gene_type:complete